MACDRVELNGHIAVPDLKKRGNIPSLQTKYLDTQRVKDEENYIYCEKTWINSTVNGEGEEGSQHVETEMVTISS